jgi:putative tricarboxylic transport membrane protein
VKRLEQVTAVLVLAMAAAAVLGTTSLAFWQGTSPGPRFMPLMVAVFCGLLAALLLIEAMRRQADQPVDWPDRAGVLRVVCTAACIVGFIALAPLLGFVVGSAAFVLVLLLAVLRRALLPSLITAAITAGIIQGVFVSWLGTALPRGVFGV